MYDWWEELGLTGRLRRAEVNQEVTVRLRIWFKALVFLAVLGTGIYGRAQVTDFVPVTDNISVTPALYYLSRPLGQATPDGQSFGQIGGVVVTTFSF